MTSTRFATRFCAAALLALFSAACTPTVTPDGGSSGPMRPPGLYSQPAQLAFTCVTPGCSESITARLTVSGDRRVAIKRDGTVERRYVYGEAHAGVLKQRRMFFTRMERPTLVLWWVEEGHQPSLAEAHERLERLGVARGAHGGWRCITDRPQACGGTGARRGQGIYGVKPAADRP